MADPVKKIENEALKLPPGDRARLAERLISSLDPGADPDSQRVWLEEAERRLDEISDEGVATVSADEVFDRARSSIR
jgi:putative addiction module component (TIGR02574 family)